MLLTRKCGSRMQSFQRWSRPYVPARSRECVERCGTVAVLPGTAEGLGTCRGQFGPYHRGLCCVHCTGPAASRKPLKGKPLPWLGQRDETEGRAETEGLILPSLALEAEDGDHEPRNGGPSQGQNGPRGRVLPSPTVNNSNEQGKGSLLLSPWRNAVCPPLGFSVTRRTTVDLLNCEILSRHALMWLSVW